MSRLHCQHCPAWPRLHNCNSDSETFEDLVYAIVVLITRAANANHSTMRSAAGLAEETLHQTKHLRESITNAAASNDLSRQVGNCYFATCRLGCAPLLRLSGPFDGYYCLLGHTAARTVRSLGWRSLVFGIAGVNLGRKGSAYLVAARPHNNVGV